ncbi:MAG: hypothetical protein JWQ35_2301 [Bacteriovoracaceae bacterium]|nr:hypothetical protein [Bacteriovoracaceae bacterium]
MKKMITISLMAFAISASAFAEAKKSLHDQFTGQGYGAAGCGLGSILFGQKPGMVQVLAATTNGTFGTQTFGISSGTSNCDHSRATAAIKTEFFAAQNEVSLKNDIAKGNGETLSTLTRVANCGNSQQAAAALKVNFSEIYPSSSASSKEISSKIVHILSTDKSLSCKLG